MIAAPASRADAAVTKAGEQQQVIDRLTHSRRDAIRARNAWIVTATAAGWTPRRIAASLKLSRQAILKIIRGQLPVGSSASDSDAQQEAAASGEADAIRQQKMVRLYTAGISTARAERNRWLANAWDDPVMTHEKRGGAVAERIGVSREAVRVGVREGRAARRR